jgi:acid phosphatase (class A)
LRKRAEAAAKASQTIPANKGSVRMLVLRRAWLTAALLVPALAASTLVMPAWADEPVPYVTDKQVDLSIILPPPTVAGSQEDRVERNYALAVQKAATPERIALANADAKESVFDMFTRTFGPSFSRANLPVASVFFDRVGESEDATTDPAKKFFGRVRPFLADPEIKALVPASKSGAYPSGHTTRVTMMAILLAGMLPERRDAIWARAEEYEESRIIGGMHYPNDLIGGRLAGTAMAAVMLADPAFKADYTATKDELRKVLQK